MASSFDSDALLEQLTASIHFIYEHIPFILLQLHIILAAIFPIYTGCHAALTRPASAQKAPKTSDDVEEEEEQEEDSQILETLTASDALVFPLTAGIVLATLYWLIKRYGAAIINKIMAWYFASVGVFSIAKLFNDSTELIIGFLCPRYIAEQGKLYKLVFDAGYISRLDSKGNSITRSKASMLWKARTSLKTQYVADVYIMHIEDVVSTFSTLNAVSTILGFATVLFSNLVYNPWWLTNVQGFAVSYFALQFMSPTSFVVGSLVLSGLFFYDIWAVFFTPLMVTVATQLDQPIKLLFPKPGATDDRAFSMLGLGDIIVPGLMIGLALRFDLHLYYKKKQDKIGEGDEVQKATYTPATGHWGSRFWTRSLPRTARPVVLQNAAFPKTYLTASLLGYVSGMLATLTVMYVFQHAQPALLYLVPAVLSSLWGTALIKGELSEMWSYTEELTGEAVVEQTNKTVSEVSDQDWWQYIKAQLGWAQPENDNKKADAKVTEIESKKKSTRSEDTIVSISIKLKTRTTRMSMTDENDKTK